MGYFLNYEDPIILVDDFNLALGNVARHFVRLGYDNLTGYLAGGFPAWFEQGEWSERTGTWSPGDLADTWAIPRSTSLMCGTSTTGRRRATSRAPTTSMSDTSKST